ncbi:unnamed protein product [Lupinus luteus]|uniref:Ionotropic glutamate receptor C-terminal domain-containing protein n=1 Tax=Lupinus luteus TaxID=3873 RepID=A0AAV1WIV1_LUPLU
MHSNLTRVVMATWLFLVLILNSSYTASLSSMLTVKQLQPNVTDIQWLKRNNMKIGCDGDSFVRSYLEKVEKFKPENIINITNEYTYADALENKSIAAAFLELPYEKVFIGEYCTRFAGFTPINRFGGLGFIFQKGSPLTRDFSKAILHLSANAELKRLEEKWLIKSKECSMNMTSNNDTNSLNLGSLWVLYVISGATSTICVILSTIQWLKSSYQYQHVAPIANDATPSDDDIVLKSAITLSKQISSKRVINASEDYVSTVDTIEHWEEMAAPVHENSILNSPPPPLEANHNS